jgi:hypothetical protein
MVLVLAGNLFGRGRHRAFRSRGPAALTRWMAANVAVAQDPAGNLKPAKDKSTERIDGIVALILLSAAPWSSRSSSLRVL